MTKAGSLETIFDSLSDVTVTLIADFLGTQCGGVPIAATLAQIGVTVFPVGVVGEDAAGQQVFDALHAHHISTSGVSRLKKYATPGPGQAGTQFLHDEHPALLNLIEHARKFASASEAVYVCDHGIGAASPRTLNFTKSNRCMVERTVAARSPQRLVDFEQLTTAVATEQELERAIGIEIGGDSKKFAIAVEGIMRELKLESFLAITSGKMLACEGTHRSSSIRVSREISSNEVDVLAAIFSAVVSTGAEVAGAAELASLVSGAISPETASQRVRRDDLRNALRTAAKSR